MLITDLIRSNALSARCRSRCSVFDRAGQIFALGAAPPSIRFRNPFHPTLKHDSCVSDKGCRRTTLLRLNFIAKLPVHTKGCGSANGFDAIPRR
jgi:hypothetical protein